MDTSVLNGPETVDEAIAMLRDENGLGALYALCLNAEGKEAKEVQLPTNVATALCLCAMALWAKEVEELWVNDYQIKRLRQDGLYSIVSPKGEIVAEHLTHEEAWRMVDRLIGEPVSPRDNVVDFLYRKSLQ